MRRDRIAKAANDVREALNAAQIRELLRVVRTGQPAEGENRTQRILCAYHEFMRHYHEFGEQERSLLAPLGLGPLLDIGFWCGLIEGGQAMDRKLLSDVEVAAYNVIFVMPKLSEILIRETDKGQFTVADARGRDRQISSLRVLVSEKDRSLTDPNIIIALIRSMDKLYKALAILHGEKSIGLAIGSIDSGNAKSFDFFGASAIMEEIGALLVNVWDRVKYCSEENFRYQIELAMVAIGFVIRVKRAQSIVDEEEAQRATRLVAKSIEMLFRCGAYTEEMDAARETRASKILAPKGRTMEFKENGAEIEVKVENSRSPIEHPSWSNGHSIQGHSPSISGILSNLKDGLELEEVVEA
jgi:RNase H-fold protein (predicted Holliday junction resolvase)